MAVDSTLYWICTCCFMDGVEVGWPVRTVLAVDSALAWISCKERPVLVGDDGVCWVLVVLLVLVVAVAAVGASVAAEEEGTGGSWVPFGTVVMGRGGEGSFFASISALGGSGPCSLLSENARGGSFILVSLSASASCLFFFVLVSWSSGEGKGRGGRKNVPRGRLGHKDR